MRLGIQDHKVLAAFAEKRAQDGYKLSTDGRTLDGHWLGGRAIAFWQDGRIVTPDRGSRSTQSVQRQLRGHAAPVDFAHYKGKLTTSYGSRVRLDQPKFNASRVNRYMRMLKRVEEGRAERWQATQLFREMTGPDMDEIIRRRKSGESKRQRASVRDIGRRSRSSPQLARALRAVEDAWLAQYTTTTRNPSVIQRISDRIWSAMNRAQLLGATDADFNRAMDRALTRARTIERRGSRFASSRRPSRRGERGR